VNKIEFFVFLYSSDVSRTSLSSNLDDRGLDSFFSNMILLCLSSANTRQKKNLNFIEL